MVLLICLQSFSTRTESRTEVSFFPGRLPLIPLCWFLLGGVLIELEVFRGRVDPDLLDQEPVYVIDFLLADAPVLFGDQGKELHQGLQDLFTHGSGRCAGSGKTA